MGKRVRIWLPGVVYTLACVAGLFVIALGVLWIAGWHSPLAISNFLFIAGSLLVISAGFAAATRYEFGFVWGYWSPFRNPNNLPRGPSNGHRPGLELAGPLTLLICGALFIVIAATSSARLAAIFFGT